LNPKHLLPYSIAGFLLTSSIASAVTLTDQSELSPSNTLVDFNLLSSGIQTNPLVIGNATFSSSASLALINVTTNGFTPPPALVFGNALFSNPSGSFGAGGEVSIRIDFASPVAEVGLAWWDTSFNTNALLVYNSSSDLLETATFPGGQFGGNEAAFRGVRRGSNEIAYAIVNWTTNDAGGIDNISYGAVPEPTSAMLLLSGAALVLRRRARRSPARQG
jgi:hypothetical protein